MAVRSVRKSPTIKSSPTVFTIGHSTRTLDELVQLLRGHGIERLVDVRTIPRSRHNPQFNHEILGKALHNRRFSYRHMKSLGGLRHARRDSINTGWRNASFRGFADYMQTQDFIEALEKLIQLAKQKPTTIMCAEAVPWRCHRSMIADALMIRGLLVEHILNSGPTRPHTLTPFAEVEGKRITYPTMSELTPSG